MTPEEALQQLRALREQWADRPLARTVLYRRLCQVLDGVAPGVHVEVLSPGATE